MRHGETWDKLPLTIPRETEDVTIVVVKGQIQIQEAQFDFEGAIQSGKGCEILGGFEKVSWTLHLIAKESRRWILNQGYCDGRETAKAQITAALTGFVDKNGASCVEVWQ